MGFRLKSGNTTSFKNMGGTEQSPAKDMKTGKYKQSFESPAKQGEIFDPNDPKQMEALKKIPKSVDPDAPGTPGKPGYEPPVKRSDLDAKGKAIWDAHRAKSKTKSSNGQWKGTEGQDQDKIFDSKGNHIGDWVNDKKVMHKIPNDDNRPRKSPAKQTATTWADGTKKSARDMFNDRETAIEQRKADRKDNQKSQYWYKINGKPATKAEYIKYQNKPGGDEPGKQTNDPDASGNKAKIAKDRAKLNK